MTIPILRLVVGGGLVLLGLAFLAGDAASMNSPVRRAEEWDGEHPAGLRNFLLGMLCLAMGTGIIGQ